MRLFLALDLPDDARRAIAATASDAPGLRRVPAEQLHVTLAFLGDVEPARLPAIVAAIEAVDRTGGPIVLSPKAIGTFPPRGPARVVVVHLGGDGVARLGRLQSDLAAALASLGFAPERRAFRPHVTVARVRDSRRAPRDLVRPLDLPSFMATTLTLYRSTLAPAGATYQAVKRLELSHDEV